MCIVYLHIRVGSIVEEKMASKGEAAMAASEASYADYEAFAERTLEAKGRAIGEARERIEALGAAIEKAEWKSDRIDSN